MTPSQDPASNGIDRFAALYSELKKLARSQRRGDSLTVNTTALVHDLYLVIARQKDCSFENDRKFYAYAAKAMRNLLIDHSRSRNSGKRGGDTTSVTLDEANNDLSLLAAVFADSEQAATVESALSGLAREDERAAEVAQLYVFAGLSIEEIARLLDVSSRTIDRDWRFARAYLAEALAPL